MMMKFSENRMRRESQPLAVQVDPSPRKVSSFKRGRLAALLVASAVVCTSLAMAGSWDSAEARGSHGARSHGSVARASGGFFGHRAASRHQGGYKAELRPVRRVAHPRPDNIRRLNPDAGRSANRIQDELRPIRKMNKVQDELRPVRKFHHSPSGGRAVDADIRRRINRLSGDEKEKFYQRRQRQQDEAEARVEVNRRNLQRQQEAERQREQAREQYEETERRIREHFGDGGGGGTTSPGPTIRVNPQP
jgi:hypothetical protein